MATRVNTKFVAILVTVVLALVAVVIFLVIRSTRTAEDFVKVGDASIVEAKAAFQSGDIEEGNAQLMRAVRSFDSAKKEEPNKTEYLYKTIDALRMVVCDDLTLAYQNLEYIRGAATGIHDTLGATDKDRAYLYELMHDRERKQLFVKSQRGYTVMFAKATEWLANHPDDTQAMRYLAIAEADRARAEQTTDKDRREMLENLNKAIEAYPEDPWLRIAAGRYHLANTQRLYFASGSRFSEVVEQSYMRAFEEFKRALKLSVSGQYADYLKLLDDNDQAAAGASRQGTDNPAALTETLAQLYLIRSQDKDKLQTVVGLRIETARVLYQMLGTKEMRDKMFTHELNVAVRHIQLQGTGIEGHPFEGFDFSQKLAEAVLADRPTDPAAYAMVGEMYRERAGADIALLEKSEKTTEDGLKVLAGDRMPNGEQFVQDMMARLRMLTTLAEVKIVLAELETQDQNRRRDLLVEAGKLIEQLAKAPSPNDEWRDARSKYLRGRIDFAFNRPRQAIVRLEEASKFHKDQDLTLLNLIAETHRKLGNDNKVVETYEKIVELNPLSPYRLTLVHMYLNQDGDEPMRKATGHLNIYRNQFPNNVMAIRLQAALMSKKGDNEGALALLQQQDLEKYPEIKNEISQIKQKLGQVDEAIDDLRAILADRPEGSDLNLSVLSRLLSMLPTEQAKLAEIDRLEKQEGLRPKLAVIFRKLVQNGRLLLDDELTLLEAQGFEGGALAIRKFMIYNRWNEPDQAKAELEKAIRMAPNLPEVIEARFATALQEQRWDDAELAIKDVLKLEISARPDMAIAEGAFMRAQVTASRAASMEPGEEQQDKLLREAKDAYVRALATYSHYVDGWVQLGRVQMVQGNYFAAKESFRQALSRQSRNIGAMVLLAQAEMATDDHTAALELYEDILVIQPTNTAALNAYTSLAQKLGMPTRAIAQRKRIRDRVQSDYGNRRALSLLLAEDDNYDDAKAEIDEVIKREGRTQQNLAVLSRVLVLGDKSDRAIQEVQGYMAQRGDAADWRDHLLMAQTYEWAGERSQAEASYRKAIALEDPKTAEASLAWAQTLQLRGELAKAAAIYNQLLKDRPDNELLKSQTVKVFLAAGEFKQAEDVAVTLNQSPERYRLLIESAKGQDQRAEAIKRARDGIKAFPTNLELRVELAQLLLNVQQRRPKSERDLSEPLGLAERLIKDYPDRVEVQLLVADVYLAMGQNDRAVAQLAQIIKFAPSHLPANERLYAIKITEARELQLTSLEASRNKANEALGIVTLLLKARPELAILYRRAGEAADLAGMHKQAAEHYRMAFEKTRVAQDLASYVLQLLEIDRGADARSVLEDPANVDVVGDNLFLRALRGRALVAAGEPDMAATLFQNTLRSANEPIERELLVRQAAAAFAKTPERAVEIVESVLGKDLPVELDAALADMMIKEKRHAEAANRLSKYEINPVANPLVQFRMLSKLGIARQESDQLQAAKKTYEMAREIMLSNPDLVPMREKVHLLNNLAYLLADRMTGFEQESIKYAREALAALPKQEIEENVALIEDTLGWALFRAGQYEEAIKVLSSSVNKYELSANLLHLGRAYLKRGQQGDKNKALDVLQRAVRRAKADKDEEMTKEAEQWLQQAL